MPFLEIACFNPESALVASSSGADRIELCDNADVGGTTPSPAALSTIRNQIKIPIFVMIRPRGGNFLYTDEEYGQMKANVNEFKSLADGFVFGILTSDGKVDVPRTSELVALADPQPCTFHRAFDEAVDLLQALENVVQCGMKTILTSGGSSSAAQGCDVVARLVEAAQRRIQIMPGGGVRSLNIGELRTQTSASWYHSSALVEKEKVASVAEIKRLKILLQGLN